VVADQQHRPVLRDAFHAADLGAEVQAGDEPGLGEPIGDVLRVPLVQVGAGNPGRGGAGHPIAHPSHGAVQRLERIHRSSFLTGVDNVSQ
jgi:hypothetical protein